MWAVPASEAFTEKLSFLLHTGPCVFVLCHGGSDFMDFQVFDVVFFTEKVKLKLADKVALMRKCS